MNFFLKSVGRWLGKALGWFIIAVLAIIVIAASIIFASYILLYVLGVIVGVFILCTIGYFILKLIGFK